MTKHMNTLMFLYAAGARGVRTDLPMCEIDWQALLETAKKQGVYYDVAYGVRLCPSPQIPAQLREKLRLKLIGACLQRGEQTRQLAALLSRMQGAGLHPAVLKGLDVARFYACPQARICADTDILVPPQEEKAAQVFLRSEGFAVEKRVPEDNHCHCTHPSLGLVELHILLFRPEIESSVFPQRICTTARRIAPLPEGEIPVLEAQAALCFLCLHLIKHFLTNGINLRMVMDYGLFCRSCTPLEREFTVQTLENFGFAALLSAVNGLLIQHMGFSQAELLKLPACTDEQVQLLADDLERSYYEANKKDAQRLDAWNEICENRLRSADAKRRRVYRKMMWAQCRRNALPSRAELAQRYPALHKCPFLYPFFWLRRLALRAIPRLLGRKPKDNQLTEKEASKQAEEAANRRALLRGLGIE